MNNQMLTKLAVHLMTNRTASEIKFSRHLRSVGIQFQEQQIICGYIPDFYFPLHGKKIIELDGRFHDGQRDAVKDAVLLENGYQVLRVPSSAVFKNLAWLMSTVSEFLGTPIAVPVGRRRKTKKVKRPKKLVGCRQAKIVRLNKQGLPKSRQW
jgi:very-short-patch-repair endonuclease